MLGYTLSLFISFLLLVISLFAFKLVADQASSNATHAQFKDVGNRVVRTVLEALAVGTQRAGSLSDAPSDRILFSKSLSITPQAHGRGYTVALLPSKVTITSTDGTISETVALYTPPVSTCAASVPVCQYLGSRTSGDGRLLVKYEYDRTAATHPTCAVNPVNCVTLS